MVAGVYNCVLGICSSLTDFAQATLCKVHQMKKKPVAERAVKLHSLRRNFFLLLFVAVCFEVVSQYFKIVFLRSQLENAAGFCPNFLYRLETHTQRNSVFDKVVIN